MEVDQDCEVISQDTNKIVSGISSQQNSIATAVTSGPLPKSTSNHGHVLAIETRPNKSSTNVPKLKSKIRVTTKNLNNNNKLGGGKIKSFQINKSNVKTQLDTENQVITKDLSKRDGIKFSTAGLQSVTKNSLLTEIRMTVNKDNGPITNKTIELCPNLKSQVASSYNRANNNNTPTNIRASENVKNHKRSLVEEDDSRIKSVLVHATKKSYMPVESVNVTDTFLCSDCNSRFAFEKAINEHLKIQSCELQYQCFICNRELIFTNWCLAWQHIQGHGYANNDVSTSSRLYTQFTQEMINRRITFQKFVPETSQTNMSHLLPFHINENLSTKNFVLESGQMKTSLLLYKPIVTTVQPTIEPAKLSSVIEDTITNENSLTGINITCFGASPMTGLEKHHSGKTISSTIVKETVDGNDKDVLIIEYDTDKVKKNNKIETITIEYDNRETQKCDTDQVNENLKDKVIKMNDNAKMNIDTGINLKQQSDQVLNKTMCICEECGRSYIDMRRHLTGTNRPNPKLFCKICKLFLSTHCSFRIHIRLHTKQSPHKCPDCGRVFTTCDGVQKHFEFSCNHLAKCVQYKCSNCKKYFDSSDDLSNHIKIKHCKDIYNCRLCNINFEDKRDFYKHRITHPTKLCEETVLKQSSLCPERLLSNDDFIIKLEKTIYAKDVLVYGYKCPHCFVVFENKWVLISHQLEIKRKMEQNLANTKIKK